MLAIQSRSFNTYYYMTDSNTIHPPEYIDNKVAGVLADNRIDHVCLSGRDNAFVSGTNMLPSLPYLLYLRHASFVREEWNAFFSNNRANVDGGWRGALYTNLAQIEPKTSYQFFCRGVMGKWDGEYLDSSQSMTWCLMWSASLGGAGENVFRYLERRAWERFRERRLEKNRERRRDKSGRTGT